MSATCRRDAWSWVFLKQYSSVSWSRRGSGGEECLSWPGDLCLAQGTPSCLVYKAWGKDGRDALGPYSHLTRPWCFAWIGCSQVWHLSGLSMVLSANEGISPQDKVPLGNQRPRFCIPGRAPGRLCGWRKALRAPQSWSPT